MQIEQQTGYVLYSHGVARSFVINVLKGDSVRGGSGVGGGGWGSGICPPPRSQSFSVSHR